MKIFGQEIEARERAFVPTSGSNTRKTAPRLPTAATLVANSSESNRNRPTCVYCDREHTSNSCPTVTDVAKRKESLRKAGRCFVCLRRHHLSKDCRSSFNCRKCHGRHHISICPRTAGKPHNPSASDTERTPTEVSGTHEAPQTTSSLYAGDHSHILLQTARLELINPKNSGPPVTTRAMFDIGLLPTSALESPIKHLW